MTLGPVRVMGAGMVVMMCVEKVCTYFILITVTNCCVPCIREIIANSLICCASLTNPDNGIINCSLGDDRVPQGCRKQFYMVRFLQYPGK